MIECLVHRQTEELVEILGRRGLVAQRQGGLRLQEARLKTAGILAVFLVEGVERGAGRLQAFFPFGGPLWVRLGEFHRKVVFLDPQTEVVGVDDLRLGRMARRVARFHPLRGFFRLGDGGFGVLERLGVVVLNRLFDLFPFRFGKPLLQAHLLVVPLFGVEVGQGAVRLIGVFASGVPAQVAVEILLRLIAVQLPFGFGCRRTHQFQRRLAQIVVEFRRQVVGNRGIVPKRFEVGDRDVVIAAVHQGVVKGFPILRRRNGRGRTERKGARHKEAEDRKSAKKGHRAGKISLGVTGTKKRPANGKGGALRFTTYPLLYYNWLIKQH